MPANKVLIVDDNQEICEILQLYMKNEGLESTVAYDGETALSKFHSMHPDIILLDIMLPGIDGMQVLREIRKTSEIPVIMITAKNDTYDMVRAYENDVDYYITKPFEKQEVLAVLHRCLRRLGRSNAKAPDLVVSYDKLSVNLTRFELCVDGKLVDTPPKELELLYTLASNPNHVYTRDQLLDEVWGFDYYGDSRTIDVHIKRLREKLEGVSDQWELRTVWGVGYKFSVMEDAN